MATPQSQLTDPLAGLGDLLESGDNRDANRAYARSEASRRGLDADFVDRLFTQESGYNPRAYNRSTRASGIGQVIPSTQKQLGIQNPWNSQENINKSLDYLQQLHTRFGGDQQKVAAGYFAGPDAAESALANPQKNPKTKAYVDAVAGNTFAGLEDLMDKPEARPFASHGGPDPAQGSRIESLLTGLTAANPQGVGRRRTWNPPAQPVQQPTQSGKYQWNYQRPQAAPQTASDPVVDYLRSLGQMPSQVQPRKSQSTTPISVVTGKPVTPRTLAAQSGIMHGTPAPDPAEVAANVEALKNAPDDAARQALAERIGGQRPLTDEERGAAGQSWLAGNVVAPLKEMGANLLSAGTQARKALGVGPQGMTPAEQAVEQARQSAVAQQNIAGEGIVPTATRGAIKVIPALTMNLPAFAAESGLERYGQTGSIPGALGSAAQTYFGLGVAGKAGAQLASRMGGGTLGRIASEAVPLSTVPPLAHGQAPSAQDVGFGLAFSALGGRHEDTVPERPETLTAQYDALREGRGNRQAVLVTKGEKMPVSSERLQADGFAITRTKQGTFIHDPEIVPQQAIRQSAKDGSFHQLLGIVEPKSPATTATVVAKENDNEVQAAQVSPENVDAQSRELAAQFPNATIETGGPEKAAEVVSQRQPDIHHSQLQPRDEEGKFNGPPDLLARQRLEYGAENQIAAPEHNVAEPEVIQQPESPKTQVSATTEPTAENVDAQTQGQSVSPTREEYINHWMTRNGFERRNGQWYAPSERYPFERPMSDEEAAVHQQTHSDNYDTLGRGSREEAQGQEVQPQTAQAVPEVSKEAAQDQALAEPPATTGIARRVEEARRGPIADTGKGISAQESVEHGRELLREGRDPQSAVNEFRRSGAISADAMALVRAKHEELARAANRAFDVGGQNVNDPAFKTAEKARQDFWENSVRPMQTEWSNTGRAQQGETAIDTGTFYGLYRAFKQETGREMTTGEQTAAQRRAGRVAVSEQGVKDAERQLIDKLNQAAGIKDLEPDVQKALSRFVEESKREARTQRRQATKKTLDSEAAIIKSNLAAAFKKVTEGSGTHPFGLAGLDPEGEITKYVIEYAKNRVKAGIVDAAQLVDDVHAAVKDFADVGKREIAEVIAGLGKAGEKRELTDWMKAKGEVRAGLKTADAANQLADIGKRLSTGEKMTADDVKTIWRYANEKYTDKGVEFGDTVQGLASDLSATPERVRRALATSPGVKPLADAVYQKMSQRRAVRNAAEQWVKNADRSPALKAMQGLSDTFFNLKTFGHGTVGPLTHAGENIFHPSRWVNYFKNMGRTWRAAYSSSAHERYMQDLVNDPNYLTARRAGLANEPGKFYDEYQNNLAAKMFGEIGKIGNRGFDVLKTMRQDFFNQRWDKLDDALKTPEMAKAIADLTNHATGAIRTQLPMPNLTRGVFFAAPLEVSRWARILGDPARALGTFSDWKNAKPADRYFAKAVVRNHAEFMATYLGALALNQAVLSASGSDDKINFTDPSKGDWLRLKIKGRAIEPTGGLISTIDFLGKLGQAALGPPTRDSRFERMGTAAAKYVRGKLSPFASTAVDVATQSDFTRRPLPFSSDEGRTDKPRYTWPEYLITQQSPIPIAEGSREFFDAMHKEGVPDSTTKRIFRAVSIGAFSGGTGVRIGSEYAPKGNDFPTVPLPPSPPQPRVGR